VRPVDWFLLGAIVLIFCPVWYLAMGEILSWAGDKAIRHFYRKERDAMEAICLCCKRIGTVNPDDIGYTCEFCHEPIQDRQAAVHRQGAAPCPKRAVRKHVGAAPPARTKNSAMSPMSWGSAAGERTREMIDLAPILFCPFCGDVCVLTVDYRWFCLGCGYLQTHEGSGR
jgi:hypothetical protein